MKFPWQRRADEEQAHRIKAEKRLADALADWPPIQHHAAVMRAEKELNGWTDTLALIFGTPKQPRKGNG